MKMKKGKNLFLCKIWNYEGLWETPNYFFCLKKKEKKKREKTFSCIAFEMMKVFWKLPIIYFLWKRKKNDKNQLFLYSIRNDEGLLETPNHLFCMENKGKKNGKKTLNHGFCL